jgi:cephalosporin hydroxylase
MVEKAVGLRKHFSFFEKHPIGFGPKDLPRWPFHAVGQRARELGKLRRKLAALKVATDSCRSVEELVDKVQDFPEFRTDQKRSELVSLLTLLARQPPTFLCEIGSALGGTLFLLARVCSPDALIISVDFGVPLVRRLVHRQMAAKGQRIISICGDSRSSKTISRLKSILAKNRLDCLFIDGDHSLEGVTADFVNYSPLVRAGGTIVFHDIIPDYKSRFGIEGSGWTGDVHKLWQQLRSQFCFEEFVEDPAQDGYGLGVIHWSQDR